MRSPLTLFRHRKKVRATWRDSCDSIPPTFKTFAVFIASPFWVHILARVMGQCLVTLLFKVRNLNALDLLCELPKGLPNRCSQAVIAGRHKFCTAGQLGHVVSVVQGIDQMLIRLQAGDNILVKVKCVSVNMHFMRRYLQRLCVKHDFADVWPCAWAVRCIVGRVHVVSFAFTRAR